MYIGTYQSSAELSSLVILPATSRTGTFTFTRSTPRHSALTHSNNDIHSGCVRSCPAPPYPCDHLATHVLSDSRNRKIIVSYIISVGC